MVTRIYLVRHCESEGNVCRRNHAQFDNVPTRKGLLQAEALADRFRNIRIDAIYSSDQYRSVVTARAIADRKGLEVRLRRLLREYTIGTWEGTGIGEMARDYPELWDVFLKTPWKQNIPGCDSFETVAQRGYRAIMDIVNENRGGTAVAVSHLTTISCALTKLFGRSIDEYASFPGGDNTAVTLLEIDDDDNVKGVFFGDISHLPDNLRRTNYTGRTAETNFAFDRIDDSNMGVFLEMFRKHEVGRGNAFDAEKALQILNESLSLGRDHSMIAVLMGRPCGFFIDRNDSRVPADHGFLDRLYMVEDITEPGMAAQIFGEALDRMRRADKRYIVLAQSDDVYTRFFLERFIFEPVPGCDGFQRMRITVPGIEGPVY